MAENPLPDFIIVGPQKCATTWLYECLYEHPEVHMPETDSVHYFNINYHRNEQWYRKHFSEYGGEPIVGEETPTYIRDENAPKRIAETVPDVKLIFTLRNPVDRAYSHWWHERSKNKHSFEFKEVFENYDLYQNWVVPGFYHQHLMRYREHIPEENIKVALFDDLVEDDLAYVQDIYSFLDVDSDYVPSLIGEKSNQGKFRSITRSSVHSMSVSAYKKIAPRFGIDLARPIYRRIKSFLASQSEYEQGMDDDIRKLLEKHYIGDLQDLSTYLNRDFDHWLRHHNL
ncbi:MAG: sulfotransferase domain-containing protein [Halobacteriaceae archaeon]